MHYSNAIHYRVMSAGRQPSIYTAFGLWAAAVAGGAVYGAWQGYHGHAYVVTLCILAFFLAIQISFATENLGERLARRTGPQRGVLCATVPLVAYLVYLAGTNSFAWSRAGFAAAYTLAPVLLATIAGTAKAGVWPDYLAMLAIFLPLKLRWLNGFWPYPGGKIAPIATMLLAVSVALATFLFVRQFDGVGYNIVWGRDVVLAMFLNFGLLAVILIPLGTALHFIKFDPAHAHWRSLPGDALFILLLTAWPEELLFRGLLQNSLSRTLRSQLSGWIAASVIFGLAHITNSGAFPNWRYALLAAIAGIFYGRAWRKTKSILPAAIVHTLVDSLWRLTFRTL